MIKLASGVPRFAMILDLHVVLIRSHKFLQRTCSVFRLLLVLLTDIQRECCAVQYEAHLVTFEATWCEQRCASDRNLHTNACT